MRQDLNIVLQRINELLVTGGLLISKTVCAGEVFSRAVFLMKPFSKLGILPHISRFSFSEREKSISQNWLKILETKKNDKNPMEYFIVAQK